MSKSDCLSADWKKIGMKDGETGEKISKLESRKNHCTKHNISINSKNYLAGRKQGLAKYCVPTSGYRVGRNGVEYHYVCPAELEKPFLKEYAKGLSRALGDIDHELRDLYFDIQYAERHFYLSSRNGKRYHYYNHLFYLTSSRSRLYDQHREIKFWLDKAIERL